MSAYDALLGTLSVNGAAIELGSGLNFIAPLTAVRNALTKKIDISSAALPVSTTTADYVQPAVGGTVVVEVQSSAGFFVGLVVMVEGGGVYEVVSVGDVTHAQLENLGSDGAAAPATTVTSPARAVPSGPPGADGVDGVGATLLDETAAPLTADTSIATSGTIAWRRINGKNQPTRRGVYNILDYGGKSSLLTRRVTAFAAGSTVATLFSAADFAIGDPVVVFGAGAAHTMRAPMAPAADIVGTPGSTTREYKIAWLDADFGLSVASAAVTLTTAPAILGDPNTNGGKGITSDGDWIRLRPQCIDCKASESANVAALSGLTTSDGLTFLDGEIVLLLGQTTASQNGPWAKHAGAWTRPTGFAVSGDLGQGLICRVKTGTLRFQTLWQLDTAAPFTLGTTALSFSQSAAKIGVVWHRAGGSGNWEIAGGFLANSELPALTLQFNDQGFRPDGIPAFTLPNITPPAAAVNKMLRTTIAGVSGAQVTLAAPNASGVNVTNYAIYHDNSPAFAAAYAEALAANGVIEIPAGDFTIWTDLKYNTPVRIRGAGLKKTNLRFGLGCSGPHIGDGAAGWELGDFSVRQLVQALPGGTMQQTSSETGLDAINSDYAFQGTGISISAGEGIALRINVTGVYGGGFNLRSGQTGTNGNRVSLEHCEAFSNYGTGFQSSGSDSNACLIYRCNATTNLGIGFDDSSFLGCNWIGCHAEGNTRRSYSTREAGSCQAVFVGCYAEAAQRPMRILQPAQWLGGLPGAGAEAANDGWQQFSGDLYNSLVVRRGPVAPIWTAGARRLPGTWVRPTLDTNFIYEATRVVEPRLAGGTEPAWPTVAGTTVVDGNITWTCRDYRAQRVFKFGKDQDTILETYEDNNPRGLNHSLKYNTSTRSIHAGFVGALQGDAYSWRGLGAVGNKSRAAGMLYFPSFILTGVSTVNYRRFGWSVGVPAFPGIYSLGDTFFDMSGTGRIYKAAVDFGIGATWQANHSYLIGEVVYPTTPDGFCYTCITVVSDTNTATSGATEPTWGGGTINDGTCQWQRHGVITPQWTVTAEMKDGAHLTDANATIALSAGHKRTLHVPLTANRTIRLANTGTPAKGAVISILRLGLGAFTLTILDDVASTTLHTIPASTARQVDLRWDGTNWQGPETGAGGWSDVT